MNKHLLALAAGVATLALMTGASAQSTGNNKAYTNQAGDNETMTVTQTGSKNLAGLDVGITPLKQLGSGNSLIVNQSGSENVVGKAEGAVASGSGTLLELSKSSTYPTGYYNGATQNGKNNTLNLNQSGFQNWISYQQTGNNNGNIAAGATNGSTGLGAFETPNYGSSTINAGSSPKWNYVNQTGSVGDIRINQLSNNSEVVGKQGVTGSGGNGIIANQGGIFNTIDLNQTTGYGGSNLAYFDQRQSDHSTARVDQSLQYGSGYGNNLVDVRQSGSGSGIAALQRGAANDLFAVQKGNVFAETVQDSGSIKSGIVLRQTGTGTGLSQRNYVYAYQGTISPFGGQNNKLTVDQVGMSNSINSKQTQGNTASFSQTSDSNSIVSTQYYDNSATVAQLGGTNNSVTNLQSGSSSYLIGTQNGSNNILLNTQTGYNSKLDATQNGSTNTIDSKQNGTGVGGNELTVLQVGNHLMATSVQDGYAIKANVDQNGSYNTYTGNQSGYSQTAMVYQGATYNVANVVQTGNNNTATIRQNR